jgi:23S rRNA (guanosine2251-2'-O)-methyltransferase
VSFVSNLSVKGNQAVDDASVPSVSSVVNNPPASDADLILGRLPVLEALRAQEDVREVLVAEGAVERGPLAELVGLARRAGVAVRHVPRAELDRRAAQSGGSGHHQGVVAVVAAFAYADLDEILAQVIRRGEAPLLLALDEVQDVHNLGSLIRTAEAVGAHGVLLPERRSAGVTPAVRKASAGAVAWLPVARLDLPAALDTLAERGLDLIGLDQGAELAYTDCDLRVGLVLIVGGEARGISKPVARRCTRRVGLPMRGHVAALNAAVAGSVVLYEVLRQRMV